MTDRTKQVSATRVEEWKLPARGGWETIEMVQKYAQLAPSHIASHAKTVTFWSQHEPEKAKAAEKAALTY